MKNPSKLVRFLSMGGAISASFFSLSAAAAISCSVSLPDIDFGNVNATENRARVNPQLSVSCSGGPANGSLTYTVRLNYSGILQGVSSDTIPYELFKDSGRMMPWGLSGVSDTLSFTGAGVSRPNAASRMTIYGEVLGTNFRNVTPGTYSDTVGVTVEY